MSACFVLIVLQREVRTRFAPSPSGFLHLGGARTALFNWLFARKHGGRFLLRIEDTDASRSSSHASRSIRENLAWLGLHWDDEVVYQSARKSRHVQVAQDLLSRGRAYRCYCTPQELEEMRMQSLRDGGQPRYDGRWRDRNPAEAPKGSSYTIRLKSPREGSSAIDDLVQGRIQVCNRQLDDMILLRADGSPTYTLSVVVDDLDMGITHVIRGDDHLNNAFRQKHLYWALEKSCPAFAHIPLVHAPDGRKYTKREESFGLEVYRNQGYLPEAMRNALLRLGWSDGDREIIPDSLARSRFDFRSVGRSSSRFDPSKLRHLNAYYLRQCSDSRLRELLLPFVEKLLGRDIPAAGRGRLDRGMPALKKRAHTLLELATSGLFYLRIRPLPLDRKARRFLGEDSCRLLVLLRQELETLECWNCDALETSLRNFALRRGCRMQDIAQPVRVALTGSFVSPGIFEVLVALGREESLGRLQDAETAGFHAQT